MVAERVEAGSPWLEDLACSAETARRTLDAAGGCLRISKPARRVTEAPLRDQDREVEL